MAVTAKWYPKGLKAALNKEIDWTTDVIRLMLLTSSHSYNEAHDYINDVSANEVSGTNYVAEGQQLTTPTATDRTDTDVTAWASTTAYVQGDLVKPATPDGHIYMCTVAGTSDGSEPTFVTGYLRETAETGAVRWVQRGDGYTEFNADDVTWANSTITARYGILYVDTGTPATSALIGQVDFGQDESSSAGNFTVAWDPTGALRLWGGIELSV